MTSLDIQHQLVLTEYVVGALAKQHYVAFSISTSSLEPSGSKELSNPTS
jgi:hypothetical protein